jgi:energy-coupling factor transporter ATP-binding protein EcfA2
MLELKKLYFTAQGNGDDNGTPRNIIDSIDFNFEKGKFYVITGPNGSGKIANDQLTKLMSLGLTYDEAVNRIIQGFLK